MNAVTYQQAEKKIKMTASNLSDGNKLTIADVKIVNPHQIPYEFYHLESQILIFRVPRQTNIKDTIFFQWCLLALLNQIQTIRQLYNELCKFQTSTWLWPTHFANSLKRLALMSKWQHAEPFSNLFQLSSHQKCIDVLGLMWRGNFTSYSV